MIALRPATAEDRELLLAVFASARPELAWLPAGFVEMQYAAQEQHYRRAYADVTFSVVLIDGVPAGRLCVARDADALRLLDIALLPAFRGHGVGRALVSALIEEATGVGRPVSLFVAFGNPARSLYEGLGFEVVAEHGPDLEMVVGPRTEVVPCASTSFMPG